MKVLTVEQATEIRRYAQGRDAHAAAQAEHAAEQAKNAAYQAALNLAWGRRALQAIKDVSMPAEDFDRQADRTLWESVRHASCEDNLPCTEDVDRCWCADCMDMRNPFCYA